MSSIYPTGNTTIMIQDGLFCYGDGTPITSIPLTIGKGTVSPIIITILLGENPLITNSLQYIIVAPGYNNITFDGMNHSFSTSVANYIGFIRNGTSGVTGSSGIIVQNINIVPHSNTVRVSANNGAICQQHFTGTVINCSSSINLASGSGGIVGANSSNVQVTNCYSSGAITGGASGGIFGTICSACTATNSHSTGQIGSVNLYNNGGIFGSACISCHAYDCFSTGNIYGDNAGNNGGIYGNNSHYCQADKCHSTGMIGLGSGGVFGDTTDHGTATNCYSIGLIGEKGGGIFGYASADDTATNCYSIGLIGTRSGGIFGDTTNNSTATNCYSIGSIGELGGGIFGYGNTTNTATTCYSTGTIGDEGGGIFGSANVDNNIATGCYTTGTIIDHAGSIYGSNATESNAINCYAAGIGSLNTNYFSWGISGTNTQPNCASSGGTWDDATANTCLTMDAWISVAPEHPYLLASFVQPMDTGVAMFGSPIGYCYQFTTRTNPTTHNGTSTVQLVNGSYQQALEAVSGQYVYTDNIYGYNILTYDQITDVHPRVIILYVYLKSRVH